MSKRWTGIVAGITLAIAVFFNIIYTTISYIGIYRVFEHDFMRIMGRNLLVFIITTAAFIIIIVGAFSNKLGIPMLVGTGLLTAINFISTFISLIRTNNFTVGDFFLGLFSVAIPVLVPALLLIMTASTMVTRRRVTNLFVVPAILNFVSGFVNLVVQGLNMPHDFVSMFRSLFMQTTVMLFYTVAYLFIGMFIEGKGIALEREGATLKK